MLTLNKALQYVDPAKHNGRDLCKLFQNGHGTAVDDTTHLVLA